MTSILTQLHDTAEPMEPPRALPAGLPPVEAFSPEMLPEVIRNYVMDVAQRQQSAPEYCAVVALVGLAGVVGRKVLMRPKRYDDWTVTPNLWGALIGGPSSMKSPSLKAMSFPLDVIEKELRQEHEATLAQHAEDAEIVEMERQAAKKRAKQKAEKGDRDGARSELAKVANLEEPSESPPRLTVNDTSVEKLGELLNENSNGLIHKRDELSGWMSKMQQDEHASDRAFYLECFNGDGRYVYDRIGRGTIAIENCTLSIIGGIQPAKIAPIVRGVDDGLIQRFQLAVWPDQPKQWQWVDRAPSAQAKDQYRQAFYALHGMAFETEDGEPPTWRFSDQAQAEFITWMEELHAEARSGDLPPALESHLLKMPKTVCALALLFALVDGEQGEVGHASTCRALAWAEFLRSHTERLYSAVTGSQVAGAHLIHQRRAKLPQPFTVRDVRRKQWAGLANIEEVREAIEVLEDYHHVRRFEVPAETGRSKTIFYWHPSLEPKEGES
ncbi:YfjI family protein [Halomonas sp.]|uniref:YfjI family protein n=1 Tax=Halomonas sp. TaxID=1486246 RepID=UPI00384B0C17